MENEYKFFKPQYEQQKNELIQFIEKFEDSANNQEGGSKYINILQQVANGEQKTINIFYEDLEDHFYGDKYEELRHGYKNNTQRYVQIFSEICDTLMPSRMKALTEQEKIEGIKDSLNVHRESNIREAIVTGANQKIHPLLNRKFSLNIIKRDPIKGGFKPGNKNAPNKIRDLKSSSIGALIQVKAIVTRTTEVRPLMQVACLFCEICGAENYQTVSGKIYTPIIECSSDKCKMNKSKGKLVHNSAASKYISYQEIKIQETSDQTPPGNVPRMSTVIVKGQHVRQCSPGDVVLIQGILLPKEYENKFGSNTMLMDTYIECMSITQVKKKYVEMELSQEVSDKIDDLRNVNQEKFQKTYNSLAQSIAPEIYGLEDVKKALLLLMVSGVTLQRTDGMNIRGDINIALIGDPGIAKSQLLKHIQKISPRGIYTTGKGSSGVGLTASVMKDPSTGEITLEAGALVLADKGVCCIDEFDKMNESDRTSIHEVMEQQTVSIAKAGITTTLNARTSVLAAANPLYGRYNKKQSIHKNINLPPALMSRFDLIFILLDECDKNQDLSLARHIGNVHKSGSGSRKVEEIIVDLEVLKGYIAKAKQFEPTFPQELHEMLVQRYVDERQKQAKNDGQCYTTPRTLLGLIRLSQALAKLDFRDAVNQNDVDEAIRLMEKTQENVQQDTLQQAIRQVDPISDVWNIIVACLKYNNERTEQKSTILQKCINKGRTESELQTCISQYVNLGLLIQTDDSITMV